MEENTIQKQEFKCQICQKVFLNIEPSEFFSHLRTHLQNNPTQNVSRYELDDSQNKIDAKLKCEICEKTFNKCIT